MPPPNVTGQLHMGHAVDNTMQDILIRTKRMQGYAALWVPGTDHASIATEAKVVEAMRAEGLTKEMVGRDGFLERAWAWKTKYGNRIVSQLKKLGSSCDWERERFTMDEGCSEAVKEVFVRLYDKGLIYRGNRMVNWCPHCNTSISDAEVEYEAKEGSFWHLLYPVKETGEMLELATTRPETMLGDTAVAINAEDPRYKHLHGCHVVLPLLGRRGEFVAVLGANGCGKSGRYYRFIRVPLANGEHKVDALYGQRFYGTLENKPVTFNQEIRFLCLVVDNAKTVNETCDFKTIFCRSSFTSDSVIEEMAQKLFDMFRENVTEEDKKILKGSHYDKIARQNAFCRIIKGYKNYRSPIDSIVDEIGKGSCFGLTSTNGDELVVELSC